jgi:DNA-binding transcriptional MerR regulator
MQRAGNRRYYRPADVDLARRINRLLNEEGYTVRGVQKVLRDKEAAPEDQPASPQEMTAPSPPPVPEEAQPSGVDVSRLIALRDRLASALDL